MNTIHEQSMQQTITIRVVFDGAPFAGKTTAAYALGQALGQNASTPEEDDGRTVWFDWVTYEGGQHDGKPIRVELVTVPGQEDLAGRRNHLLGWGDVVVFIADSSEQAFPASVMKFSELRAELQNQHELPLVVIANKRDLDDALPLPDMRDRLGLSETDVLVEGIATAGGGIREAFIFAVRAALAASVTRVEATTSTQLLDEMQAAERVQAELPSPPTAAALAEFAAVDEAPTTDEAPALEPAPVAELVADEAPALEPAPVAELVADEALVHEDPMPEPEAHAASTPEEAPVGEPEVDEAQVDEAQVAEPVVDDSAERTFEEPETDLAEEFDAATLTRELAAAAVEPGASVYDSEKLVVDEIDVETGTDVSDPTTPEESGPAIDDAASHEPALEEPVAALASGLPVADLPTADSIGETLGVAPAAAAVPRATPTMATGLALNPRGIAEGAAMVVLADHWSLLVEIANGRTEVVLDDGSAAASTAAELLSWGLIVGSLSQTQNATGDFTEPGEPAADALSEAPQEDDDVRGDQAGGAVNDQNERYRELRELRRAVRK